MSFLTRRLSGAPVNQQPQVSPQVSRPGIGGLLNSMANAPGEKVYPLLGGFGQVTRQPQQASQEAFQRAMQLQGAPMGGQMNQRGPGMGYQTQQGGVNPYQQMLMSMRGNQGVPAMGQAGPRFPSMSQYSRPYQPQQMQGFQPQAQDWMQQYAGYWPRVG